MATELEASRRATLGPLLRAAPLLVAVAAHARALANPFVYDDVLTVTANPALAPGEPLLAAVLQDRFRPLTSLVLGVEARLWGREHPFGYHLTSLALHLVTVALLFAVARRLSALAGARDPALAACAAAMLFATHPLHTEAVGYVSARAELQCAAFFLAAIALWLARKRAWLVAFLAALLSKESAVMLPFLLLGLDRLFPLGSAAEREQRLRRLHLPLCLGAAALGIARLAVHVVVEGQIPLRGPWQNLLMELGVIWRYILLLLAPIRLSLVHAVDPVLRLTEARALLAGAALLALVLVAMRARRRAPLFSLGVAWFLLVLAPSSTLLPLLEPMAEHRVYLASAGLFVAAGTALAGIGRGLRGMALVVALVLLFIDMSRARLAVWSNPVRLWTDAARKAERVWLPHYALGEALQAAGRLEEALLAYRQATLLLPGEPRAWLNLGVCLAELERFDAAEQALQRALALDPGNAAASANLRTLVRARDLAPEVRP